MSSSHHRRKQQQQSSSSSSSKLSKQKQKQQPFSVVTTMSHIIRMGIIVGVYLTITIDLFVLYTERFDDYTADMMLQMADDDNFLRQQESLQRKNAGGVGGEGPLSNLLAEHGFLDDDNKKKQFKLRSRKESVLSKPILGQDYVIQLFKKAGVTQFEIDQNKDKIPTWEQIVDLYGDEPIILGLEKHGRGSTTNACQDFQRLVKGEERMIGSAGMFNTGTNLVTQLLKQNCVIPERLEKYGANATKEQLGMRWQVSWGKHTPAHYKMQHAAPGKAEEIDKNAMLPVVTIRNPWHWMKSMCKNPYAASWPHHKQCPNLLKTGIDGQLQPKFDPGHDDWNEVTVQYRAGTEKYKSLQHLWNEWYKDYYKVLHPDNTDTSQPYYPLLMVRMEDVVFHPEVTTTAICECAGGQIIDKENFKYIEESAKAIGSAQGHDTTTGMLEAWIKYGQPLEPGAGFSTSDYEAALEAVDQNLMDVFHYQHPKLPPPPPAESTEKKPMFE